jgi:hypothetical protein
MSLGRLFRFKEGMTLSIHVELMNLFNRTQIMRPSSEFSTSSATSPQISIGAANAIWGFGYIVNDFGHNALEIGGQRTGQLVARFNF